MSVSRSNFSNDIEKDNLISNLRKQVFDLEQNEKNYSHLHEKYRQTQNDFTLACEDKLRLEYEYKQRLDSANKQVAELKNDLNTVQQTLDERVSLNKKLYQDNSALHKLAEDRAIELMDLKNENNQMRNNIEALENNRNSLERSISQLNDELNTQKNFNEKLVEDNEKLSKIVDEQDYSIKNIDAEKRKFMSKCDELNFEVKNLSGKLKSKEESLFTANRKIEDCTKTINQLDNKSAELDSFLEKTKLDLANSRKDHNKEKNQRMDCERQIEKMDGVIREKEKELKNAGADIENLRLLNDKLNEEKSRQLGEIERLKSHILVLTEQNQKYIDEIESYVEQDEKIKTQMSNRKENSYNLLRTTKNNLDRSLTNLDDYLNKSGTGNRLTSPTRYSTKAGTGKF